MLKQIAYITEPVVVKRRVGSGMIGTVFHVILQCDKCKRVAIERSNEMQVGFSDGFLGCCEKCRICGERQHPPRGHFIGYSSESDYVMKNPSKARHFFSLERREETRPA